MAPDCLSLMCLSKSAKGGDSEGKEELFSIEDLQFQNSVAGQRLLLKIWSSKNRTKEMLLETC